MQSNELKSLLAFATMAGRVMLENGAETYRVEGTIERILAARGIENSQCFVVPTGVFVSVTVDTQLYTILERVYRIQMDLMHIVKVNELSRVFVETDLSVEEAVEQLHSIETSDQYGIRTRVIFAGIAGSFMALLFKGGPLEFAGAFITSVLVAIFMELMSKKELPVFIKSVIGGMAAATFTVIYSLIFNYFSIGLTTAIVIIGAIQQLVPGVSLTNGVRDSITGDYMSGVSRATEAIIIALGIAFGVGVVLKMSYNWFGGIL